MCTVCQGYSKVSCPCCSDVNVTICPDCNGTGYAPYRALNIYTRDDVEVTEIAWMLLPDDEDAAYECGQNYCKMPRELCTTCRGDGEIY